MFSLFFPIVASEIQIKVFDPFEDFGREKCTGLCLVFYMFLPSFPVRIFGIFFENQVAVDKFMSEISVPLICMSAFCQHYDFFYHFVSILQL